MGLGKGFVYVLVVVLTNLLVVTLDVTETSTVAPRENSLGRSGLAHPVPSPTISDPPAPITIPPAPPSPDSSVPFNDLPAPVLTIPPAVSTPVVTDPPVATVPSTSPPTLPPPLPLPSPSPTPAERLAPAARFSHPASNVPPSPNFLGTCGSAAYNDSFVCVWEVVTAINNARASEGVPSMVLPTNWSALNPAEQLFVATNLERTVRGFAPLSALAPVLDAAAALGAAAGVDPKVPPGFPWIGGGSNWAGVVGNPLEALYYWMYDDGFGSTNIDCSLSNLAACWGHRQNLLVPLACNLCVVGIAWGSTAQGNTSVAELIAETTGTVIVNFTWAQEQPSIP
jgi:hypothetical protein